MTAFQGRGDLLCSLAPMLGTKGQNSSAEKGQGRPGMDDQSEAVNKSYPRLSQDSSMC